MRNRTQIFKFEDFREYLRWAFEDLKKREPSLSQRKLASLAGLKSPSHFNMILEGKRNISDEVAVKIGEAFELTDTEISYFRSLVRWNQATTESDRRLFASEILKSRGYRLHHPLSEAQYRYFRNWYYVTIHEIMGLKKWEGDPSLIQTLLPNRISPEQIEAALTDLVALGLVKHKGDRWFRVKNAVLTPDLVVSDIIADFHTQMINLGAEAIYKVDGPEREILSMTFSINRKYFEEYRELVQKLIQEAFAKSLDDPSPNQVFQLNVQLFPHTK